VLLGGVRLNSLYSVRAASLWDDIVQKKKKCVDEVLFGYKLFSRKQMYAKSHRAHW